MEPLKAPKVVEDLPEQEAPGNGEAEATPATPQVARRTIITIHTDGRMMLDAPLNDLSAVIGDVEYTLIVLKHKAELSLLEEKIRVQMQLHGHIQKEAAEAASKVVGVRGNIPGAFPGPPKARH